MCWVCREARWGVPMQGLQKLKTEQGGKEEDSTDSGETSSFASRERWFSHTVCQARVPLAVLYLVGCITQYSHLKLFSRLVVLMHAFNLSIQEVKEGRPGVQSQP